MIELPSRIQVGPYTYTIQASLEALNERNKANCCSLRGYCSYLDHTITVDPTTPQDQRGVTLFHEVMHAVAELLNLHGKFTDEEFVRRLAPALIDTFRRNPDLVAYLVAEG